MKFQKSFALVIALALVASIGLTSVALAEDVVYVNPTDGYQIVCPDKWTILSKDTINSVMTQLSEGKVEGIDASAFANYKAQIEALDMVAVISDTGKFNFNVIYQAMPMELNNELIIAQLCPATISQLKTAFGDINMVDAGTVVTVNENEYVHMEASYTLGGIDMAIEQYLLIAGKKLYVLSFTETGIGTDAQFDRQETIKGILGSFVPVK